MAKPSPPDGFSFASLRKPSRSKNAALPRDRVAPAQSFPSSFLADLQIFFKRLKTPSPRVKNHAFKSHFYDPLTPVFRHLKLVFRPPWNPSTRPRLRNAYWQTLYHVNNSSTALCGLFFLMVRLQDLMSRISIFCPRVSFLQPRSRVRNLILTPAAC